MRIGMGYDVHRLVDERALVIGGVTIPHDRGLLGHSDADVLTHAICDALLGAAGLGDIGRHFPDTDPKWEGASGATLLSRTMDLLKNGGGRFLQADLTVIAESPRLAPFREPMREALSNAVGGPVGSINVKFRTNEGLGAIGQGEAIAVHAVVLVELPDPAETAG